MPGFYKDDVQKVIDPSIKLEDYDYNQFLSEFGFNFKDISESGLLFRNNNYPDKKIEPKDMKYELKVQEDRKFLESFYDKEYILNINREDLVMYTTLISAGFDPKKLKTMPHTELIKLFKEKIEDQDAKMIARILINNKKNEIKNLYKYLFAYGYLLGKKYDSLELQNIGGIAAYEKYILDRISDNNLFGKRKNRKNRKSRKNINSRKKRKSRNSRKKRRSHKKKSHKRINKL